MKYRAATGADAVWQAMLKRLKFRYLAMSVSVVGGLGAFWIAHNQRSDFASSVLVNVGTSLVLIGVIVKLEQGMAFRVAHLMSDQLRAARPRLYTPIWARASDETQAALQVIRALDTTPLLKLAEAFGIEDSSDFKIDVPVTSAVFVALAGRERRLAESVERIQQRQLETTHRGLTESQELALEGVYDFLRYDEVRRASKDELRSVDVVLVAGARGRWIGQRVDYALDVIAKAEGTPSLILSGGSPTYETRSLGYSEAEAMAEIARDRQLGRRLQRQGRLLLEHRATSLAENVSLSLSLLQQVRSSSDHPLNLLLVTAPYALRRFEFVAQSELMRFPHIVGRILLGHGHNNWDLCSLFDLAEGVQRSDKRTPGFDEGVARWVSEYFKLIGGRAVGLF